ncbi:MAG: SulP family inorganic anion transporter [Clostridia bacterium]|nr:SulP family inorganic anion transporter [Clostridia bacterium]
MIKNFVNDLKREFSGYNGKSFSKDLMAGLTVTAVALPLALAFGVSSGADAAAGLITAIIAGLIISAFSGASFQISGPTGAMTAVLITIVAKFGMQGVFVACLIAGVLLLLFGVFKLGNLVSFIPMPVVTGFTTGIAIIIALGQIDNFFGTTSVGESALEKIFSYGTLGFSPNWFAVVIGLLVILIMVFYPKKWNNVVPSSLVAIIIAAVVSNVLKFDIAVVGEIPRTLLPETRLILAGVKFDMAKELVAPAFTIAMLAMIESLLCGSAAARMKKEPFNADQELIAQGIGNIIIPFFGGVPATAAIARTSVAIKSGGVTRLTGIIHAVGLLLSMFLLGSLMAKLPLAALAGVLMVTAWRMNEWETIKYIFSKRFKSAMSQFLITMVCTVVFDLTIAIIVGVVFSFMHFVMKSSKIEINVSKVENEKFRSSDADVECTHKNSVVMYITGSVFFGNCAKLNDAVEQMDGYDEIIFSLRGVSAIDTSGAQNLHEICENLLASGVKLSFCGVQPAVKEMMQRSGVVDLIGEHCFYWSVDKALLANA